MNSSLSQLAEKLDDTVSSSGTYSLGGNLTVNNGGYSYSNTAITNNGAITRAPYTITGSNTAPYTLGAGTGITQPWFSNSVSSKIRLDGEGADIEVNGVSLMDMIGKIEERLNILHPNTELETEWEELRALGEQYRKLEQHIKDKQATWDKLKAMPPPEID